MQSEHASPLNLRNQQWVVASYNVEHFPGEIIECDHDDIEVTCTKVDIIRNGPAMLTFTIR